MEIFNLFILTEEYDLVDNPAIFSYFQRSSTTGFNVTHFYHRCLEILEKCRLFFAVFQDKVVSGATVKYCLVGVKKPFLQQEILVVGVVEDSFGWRWYVEWSKVTIATV